MSEIRIKSEVSEDAEKSDVHSIPGDTVVKLEPEIQHFDSDILSEQDGLENIADKSDQFDLPPSSQVEGLRSRTLTEKGLQYRKERLTSHFRAATSSWRKQATRMETLLMDSEDASSIKTGRDQLITAMNMIYRIVNDLEVAGILEFRSTMDSIEKDHYDLLKRIGKPLQSLHEDFGAKSVVSKRSSGAHSRSSRSSNKSSRVSDRSSFMVKKASMAAKAASLRVELQLKETEEAKERQVAHAQAELNRLKLEKDLQIAEASLRAVEEVECHEDDYQSHISLTDDRGQVSSPIYTQVSSPMYAQVSSPMYTQVSSPMYAQVSSPMYTQVSSPMYTQVSSPMYTQVSSPMYTQVSSPMYTQVSSPMYTQVSSPMYTQVSSPMYTQVSSPMYTQVSSPMYTQVSSPMYTQVSSPRYTQVSSPMYGQVSSQIAAQVLPPLMTPVPFPVLRQNEPSAPRLVEPSMTAQNQHTSQVPVYQNLTTTVNSGYQPSTPRTDSCRPISMTSLGKQLYPDKVGTLENNIAADPTTTVVSTASLDGSMTHGLDNSLLELLLQSTNRLPLPEPDKFEGSPLQYMKWKIAFNALIERRHIPGEDKLFYLEKYLKGPAKEICDSLFLVGTESAYKKARKLLDERYGAPHIVADAFRDKLDKWPRIQARDGVSLQKLADFLSHCQAAIDSVPALNILSDERENKRLLEKLPDWLVSRWARIVVEYRERSSYPSFEKFVKFINAEAKVATDHIHPAPRNSNQNGRQNIKRSATVFSNESVGKPNNQKEIGPAGESAENNQKSDAKKMNKATPKISSTREREITVCCLCKGKHDLELCPTFAKKDLKERQRIVKDNNICFKCLKWGHFSRQCQQKKICEVCRRTHPTILHKYAVEESEDINRISNFSGSSDGGLCSMILPVFVSHRDNPEKEELVYALLDSQSDTCFILDDIAAALEVPSQAVNLTLSTMCSQKKRIPSNVVTGLIVRGLDSATCISLPSTFTRELMPANRDHIPTPEKLKGWPHLAVLEDVIPPLADCPIGLLIGYDCPKAHIPRAVIAPEVEGPFAQKSELGWGIVGIVGTSSLATDEVDPIGVSHTTILYPVVQPGNSHQSTLVLHSRVTVEMCPLQILQQDFQDTHPDDVALSQEDKTFLTLMQDICQGDDGHYEMPLPFKGPVDMPCNRSLALHRLQKLNGRLKVEEKYKEKYFSCMQKMLDKGYCEPVPAEEENAGKWYLPHHGVINAKKPDKLRVVFDASCRFKGSCLNENLLQGPDFTNSLVGVLMRFRMERVAIMCDVEQMFHQFRVSRPHQDYLRFMWYGDDNIEKEPTEFRMKVHLFGAKSSPGCANYGLKQIAKDYGPQFSDDAAAFVCRNFYVDDGLTSVPTVEAAIKLIEDVRGMCSMGALKLHKFACNSKIVMETIPEEDQAEHPADLPESQAIERALGVEWSLDSDSFLFRIVVPTKPLTRRGVLSIISSIYDPLGFIAPYVLVGKKILQEMCRDGLQWDSDLPDDLKPRWTQWLSRLADLQEFSVKRCYLPVQFGKVVSITLHHFSDASSSGYGQCSYIRLEDDQHQVHCMLIMAKARVAPLKAVTIPRLELAGAVLSAKVSSLIRKELDCEISSETFWTDSKVILGYINNDCRRFKVFVANRVQQIRNCSDPLQWRHVNGTDNPADAASRGMTPEELISSNWLNGPEFLWNSELPSKTECQYSLPSEDPEIRKVQTLACHREENPILDSFVSSSSWFTTQKMVAVWLQVKMILKDRINGSTEPKNYFPFKMKILKEAELVLIRWLQLQAFEEEIKILRNLPVVETRDGARQRKISMKKSSSLYKLNPFLDKSGILRVGGRLGQSNYSDEIKNPVILPRKHHITRLIVHHYHEKVGHQGRGMTVNEIRSSGFWIIGCSSAVSSGISKCVKCRRTRGSVQDQIMSDLPPDRLTASPPFSYCAVDCFGPFQVKEGRKILKRYGVLFTCLNCKGIHIEVAASLSTDSYLNALRRFIAVRGPVRQIRSDRGTNFVGAKRELEEAFAEMDQQAIGRYLLTQQCDYIEFKMNVPSASYQGGIWERQIRTVRSVLNGLRETAATQLDDESLHTLMYEVMAIVNNRPLTTENLFDPNSLETLTPNHILTSKSRIVLPPPGNFQKEDLYLRKRWRRVQYLTNEFWNRWRKEYINTLQVRQKWNKERRDLRQGDIVIIKEDMVPRSQWTLGRVDETYPDEDGHVRKARIAVADKSLDKRGKRTRPVSYLDRPIQKLVLLLEAEEPIGYSPSGSD